MSSVGRIPAEAREVRTERLAASPAAVAHARAFVVGVLRGWRVDAEAVDDAELVVSELVTNAFLHGAAEVVTVSVADVGPVVRLVVVHREDHAGAIDLVPQTVEAHEVHGRGLAIVDVLAHRWGVEEHAGERVVWTELSASRTALVVAGERDSALAPLLAALTSAATPRAVGDAVTAWARDRLATAFVGVALPDDDGTHLQFLSLEPLPAESAAVWTRFPVSTDAPVAAAFREGQGYFHESRNAAVAAFPALGPALEASQMAALAHLPLTEHGRPLGALAFAWSHGHELDVDDRSWLLGVADVTAHALARVGVGTSASRVGRSAGTMAR